MFYRSKIVVLTRSFDYETVEISPTYFCRSDADEWAFAHLGSISSGHVYAHVEQRDTGSRRWDCVSEYRV